MPKKTKTATAINDKIHATKMGNGGAGGGKAGVEVRKVRGVSYAREYSMLESVPSRHLPRCKIATLSFWQKKRL